MLWIEKRGRAGGGGRRPLTSSGSVAYEKWTVRLLVDPAPAFFAAERFCATPAYSPWKFTRYQSCRHLSRNSGYARIHRRSCCAARVMTPKCPSVAGELILSRDRIHHIRRAPGRCDRRGSAPPRCPATAPGRFSVLRASSASRLGETPNHRHHDPPPAQEWDRDRQRGRTPAPTIELILPSSPGNLEIAVHGIAHLPASCSRARLTTVQRVPD